MRIADRVHYLDVDGKRHAATITAVPGTGKSGAKELNLRLSDGSELADVPHEKDAAPDAGFWRELGASPVPEAEAAAEPDAPPKPKRRIRPKRKT
jgi:hypothetical protein